MKSARILRRWALVGLMLLAAAAVPVALPITLALRHLRKDRNQAKTEQVAPTRAQSIAGPPVIADTTAE